MAEYGMETSTTIHEKTDAHRFMGAKGPILEHYQKRGTMINSAYYS
jgi:hypothetical protein